MNYSYVVVRNGGRQVYEHRLVWESAFGAIPKGYQVHHINGDKRDNRLENLELMEHGDHVREHGLPRSENRINGIKRHFANIEPVEATCVCCGDNFTTRPHPAHGVSKFCSRGCRNKHHYRVKRSH